MRMMKKAVTISVTFILAVISGLAIYLLVQSEHEKDGYKRIASQTNRQYNTLQQEQEALFKNEGCTIPDTIAIRDIKGRKITMDSLVAKSPCVVLYISSLYCNDCVNYALNLIKITIIDKNVNVNILIFASGYKLRDLYVFARTNEFDETCFYNVNSLNMPIEELNMPFIFTLDDRKIPVHFFIPRKEVHQQSEKRLILIAELLKNVTQNVISQNSNKYQTGFQKQN